MRTWLASEADFDETARLLGGFRDYYGRTTPSADEIRTSIERIAGDGGEYLLAADTSEPAGVLQLRYRWSLWTTSDDAWIEDVFVLESERGKGIGRALLETAVARARARGCRRIELDVDETNAAAMGLYRDLGFREAKPNFESNEPAPEARSLLMGLRLS